MWYKLSIFDRISSKVLDVKHFCFELLNLECWVPRLHVTRDEKLAGRPTQAWCRRETWLPGSGVSYYRPQTKFAKVMFLHASVCPRGGCAWRGGMLGGVRGSWGACMAGRGACVAGSGGHAHHPPKQIPQDTVNSVNERAVRILLECMLVKSLLSLYPGCNVLIGKDRYMLVW